MLARCIFIFHDRFWLMSHSLLAFGISLGKFNIAIQMLVLVCFAGELFWVTKSLPQNSTQGGAGVFFLSHRPLCKCNLFFLCGAPVLYCTQDWRGGTARTACA